MICRQREPALAGASAATVRERIRMELAEGNAAHSVQRTHCEVIASVDATARKIYTVGGNVLNAVSTRKMNLKDDLKFSARQSGPCRAADWILPHAAADKPGAARDCSLNDRNWFVLLQLR
jgi:hypothetical protein